MIKENIKHALITGIVGGITAAIVTFFLCIGYIEMEKYRLKKEHEERLQQNAVDSISENNYGIR